MTDRMGKTIAFFAVLTLGLVGLGILVASTLPDGLEHVAAVLGFAGRESSGPAFSPFAKYHASFLENSWLARVMAGLLGAGLMYAFGLLLGKTLRKKGDG